MGQVDRGTERKVRTAMYSKNDLIDSLRRMGLDPAGTVLVHSSYKNIAGKEGVEGGADTVLDALMEYFGEKGLLVFPALTWKFGYMLNEVEDIRVPGEGDNEGFTYFGDHFDVRTSQTHDLGILPELFRQRSGVIRSLCPTSSVAAFGRDAKEFVSGHEKAAGGLSWDSPWGKLYERGAKLLFCGTKMACNTYMHAVEEHANVVPNLIMDHLFKFTVTDYDGNTFPVAFRRHEPGHSHYYDKVRPELTEKGIVTEGYFGSALTQIADAVSMADYMTKKLQDNPLLFTHQYNRH